MSNTPGYPTACITAFDLVSRLHKAYNQLPELTTIQKIRMLCIDELGIPITRRRYRYPLSDHIQKKRDPAQIVTNEPRAKGVGAPSSAPQPHLRSLTVSVFQWEVYHLEGRSYRLLKKHKAR